MGAPVRGRAPLGSSDSVFDDLRFVRFRRGFETANSEDLKGSLALPRYAAEESSSFDQLLFDFWTFTRDWFNELLEASDTGEVDRAAVRSLNTIMFSAADRSRSMLEIRWAVSSDIGKDADTIRGREDQILLRIARAFFMRSGVDAALLGKHEEFGHKRAHGGSGNSDQVEFAVQQDKKPTNEVGAGSTAGSTGRRPNSDQSDEQPTVNIVLHLESEDDWLVTRVLPSISGEIELWYLGLIRHQAGAAAPRTMVAFSDETDLTIRTNIEIRLISLYRQLIESLVHSVCLIGAQSCAFMNDSEALMKLVSAVIEEPWLNEDPSALEVEIEFVPKSLPRNNLRISSQYIPRLKIEDGEEISFDSWPNLNDLNISFLGGLGPDFIAEMGIPLLLSMWLQVNQVDFFNRDALDRQSFLDPDNWRISQAQYDPEAPKPVEIPFQRTEDRCSRQESSSIPRP